MPSTGEPVLGDPAGRRASRRSIITAAAAAAAGAAALPPNRAALARQASPVAEEGDAARLGVPENVPIDHVIVIFMENHTFDNLYGFFPGANGLNAPGAIVTQTDRDGSVYPVLPPVSANGPGSGKDARFPDDLDNAPFNIDAWVPLSEICPSPVHRFYQHQLQVNGGRMDRHVAWSDSGALTMGYHQTSQLPLSSWAAEYTLCDNFFTSAWGGSMLNHLWLISAVMPVWPNADSSLVARPVFDAAGNLVGLDRDGVVSPDGHVINDAEPWFEPHEAGEPDAARVPPQQTPTIGDRLTDAGVSWAWFAGGWDKAAAGQPAPTFVCHHQPFVYFENYAPGAPGRDHLRDETAFLASLADGALPSVSFIKPLADLDEHAGTSPILASEQHAADLLAAVKASPYWDRCAVILTYDDFGGWYDHVAPYPRDQWGPGGRVPALIVSPHARRGHIEHTPLEHCSILRFIEWRWGLAPLSDRDANAWNLTVAFDF
ncbi:MAG: acid phosphatase [Chloroflexota bacterium]